MTATIPAPPSANALYVQQRGRRVKTAAYRKWRRDAVLLLAVSRLEPMPLKTPLRVTIEVAIGRNRDVDNAIKPLVDALQEAGIIPDDRWVDELDVRRVPAGDLEAGWCRVGVSELYGSGSSAPTTE